MALVTVGEESRAQRGFYTPQFQLRIQGTGVSPEVLADVEQITYKDDIKQIDSFEITVNNWDPATRRFKYVGSETAATLAGGPDSARFRLFEPCNQDVEVRMGYLGDLQVMMKGNFTTMEPNFPNAGPPTLTVRGLNVLHQLRRKQYTTAWTEMRDSEIARNLATLRDRGTGRRRFPIDIETDDNVLEDEPVLEYVAQKTQYDIDFLFQRARERGYVVFVQETPPRKLYFGPSNGTLPALRKVTFELRWGDSLFDFKPTLTTANQVRSVTVHGWNRRTRQAIVETVSLDDAKLNRNRDRDLYELLQSCDPREEVVRDEPVFTPRQARARALAILQDQQKQIVKCTASTVGLPDLRAGKLVNITGVGSRFSGTYFVTETTHTIGAGGYMTRFSARRPDGRSSS